MTITETMMSAVVDRLEAFDIAGLPASIIAALTDAGYAIVPVEPAYASAMAAATTFIHGSPKATTSGECYLLGQVIYRAIIRAATPDTLED